MHSAKIFRSFHRFYFDFLFSPINKNMQGDTTNPISRKKNILKILEISLNLSHTFDTG